MTERVDNVLGHSQGGYLLVHAGTNNATGMEQPG